MSTARADERAPEKEEEPRALPDETTSQARPPGLRVPPHNLEAERSLIAGLFENPAALDGDLGDLSAADFYRSQHRKIFEALLRCKEDGAPIDIVSVEEHLDAEELKAIGGSEAILEVWKHPVLSSNLGYYAKVVHDKAVARRLMEAATTIVRLGYEHHGEVGELVEEARELFAVVIGGAQETESGFMSLADFAASCDKEVVYHLEPFVVAEGFSYFFAAPKKGKTFFAAWLATDMAQRGIPTLFIEEENAPTIFRKRFDPFVADFSKLPALRISHRKGWKLDDPASVRRLILEAQKFKAQVIILDPFTMLHSRNENDPSDMAIVLQAIETIIREVGCAVVVFHHTNKASWKLDAEANSANARGAGGPQGAADTIFELRPVPASDRKAGLLQFALVNTDSRVAEPWPARVVFIRPGAAGAKDAILFREPETIGRKEWLELRDFCPETEAEAVSVDKLRKRSEMGKASVQSGVNFGLRTGELVRRPKLGGVYRVKKDGLVRGESA